MARIGVTEEQIHAAADELLLEGERPTIDRIRTKLGTGSPNTVARLLEPWWAQLGKRLSEQQMHMALPAAPKAVSELASALWREALAAAGSQAEAMVRAEREQLAQDYETLEASRSEFAGAQKALETSRQRMEVEHGASLARVAHLEQELEFVKGQLERAEAQIADLIDLREDFAHRLDEALDEAKETAMQATKERESLIAHADVIENRAAQEIDRLRQTIKAAQLEAKTAAKEVRTQLADLSAQVVKAQRAEASATARAIALEQQWASLPKALQSVATVAKARPTPRKVATQKKHKTPVKRTAKSPK